MSPRLPLFLLCFAMSCEAAASCADVTRSWLGISLGPIANYPADLKPGVRREGTARFIEGVGFESLEGVSSGIEFPRIMAFFDRGRFTNILVVASIPGEKDAGLAQITNLASAVVNAQPTSEGKTFTFPCEQGVELRIEPTKWDRVDRVKITLSDPQAREASRKYVQEYCADRSRRKPGDACKD